MELLVILLIVFGFSIMFIVPAVMISNSFKDEPVKEIITAQIRKQSKRDLKNEDVLIFNEPKKLSYVINSFKDFLRKPEEMGQLNNLWYIVFITQHDNKDGNTLINGVDKENFDLIVSPNIKTK